VLVAPGVLDDVDLVDAVLGDDELAPQPVSTTKTVSVAATTAKSRRANASTFFASIAVMSGDLLRGEAAL
jgi:hypothetical protein